MHHQWTFFGAFPHLETLELVGHGPPLETSDFAFLPPSLTSLTFPSSTYEVYSQFSSILPPHLLALKITQSTKFPSSFWLHLPPQLTKLDIRLGYNREEWPSENLASLLPRSLTLLLNANFSDHPLDLKDLPSSLESLDITCLRPFDIQPYSSTLIGRVLPNLKRVCFGSKFIPQIIRTFPATTQTIEVTDYVVEFVPLTDGIMEHRHWPPALRTFSSNAILDALPLSSFPPGLTKLIFVKDLLHFTTVSTLPRTLLHLGLKWDNVIECYEIDFPPHLTYLSLFGTRQRSLQYFSYYMLPSSLVELYLASIPASELKHLPPRLKTLQVSHITVPASDPISEAERSALERSWHFGGTVRSSYSIDTCATP